MSGPGRQFVWESRIRFVDTDASGRVHYTALLRHFEAAEDEFLRSIGCAYGMLERNEASYPRVHVECDFLAAIRFGDLLSTAVTVERVGHSSFTLGFTASVNGTPAAKGRITVVCMDPATQKSRPLPVGFAQALNSTSL